MNESVENKHCKIVHLQYTNVDKVADVENGYVCVCVTLQLSLSDEDRTLLRKGTLEILQLPTTPSLPQNNK